ncbi:MAG: hypothetical protein H7174_05040, partial [Flavobacterium sp.]|nr:hypothetical protein [Flavobacterium sp.]
MKQIFIKKSLLSYCFLCLCTLVQFANAQAPLPPCGTAPVCTWTLGGWTPFAPQTTGVNEVVFATSYSSTGNLNVCSVSVMSGAAVTFNPGHTLYCTNSVNVDNVVVGNN